MPIDTMSEIEQLKPTLFRVTAKQGGEAAVAAATTVILAEEPPGGSSAKITMFDMDGTLVETKSGKKHPVDEVDWRWRPGVLERLAADAAPIIIVTNQSRGTDAESLPIQRVRQVVAALAAAGIAAAAYVATGRDGYRKPWPCIWTEYLAAKYVTACCYVGDAAGRPRDFSDSDRGFAYNIHLSLRDSGSQARCRFCTPEEYFAGAAVVPRSWAWDPPAASPMADRNLHTLADLATARVIIMVGAPGSGKSSLAAILAARFHGRIFSNDCHRSPAATLADAAAYLAAPKSGPAIIDNTHPTETLRKPAAALDAKHAILFLDYPKELATYLNELRRAQGGSSVPDVAIATYYKRLEPPPSASIWYWSPSIDKTTCPRYGMRSAK